MFQMANLFTSNDNTKTKISSRTTKIRTRGNIFETLQECSLQCQFFSMLVKFVVINSSLKVTFYITKTDENGVFNFGPGFPETSCHTSRKNKTTYPYHN